MVIPVVVAVALPILLQLKGVCCQTIHHTEVKFFSLLVVAVAVMILVAMTAVEVLVEEPMAGMHIIMGLC